MQKKKRALGKTTIQIACLLFAVASCNKEFTSLPALPIQSESELAELAKFIVPGESTPEDVYAKLGEAFFKFPLEDGGLALGFIFDSVPYEVEEGESRIGIFAPKKHGSKLISTEASIWVDFNSKNQAVSYSIRGPRL